LSIAIDYFASLNLKYDFVISKNSITYISSPIKGVISITKGRNVITGRFSCIDIPDWGVFVDKKEVGDGGNLIVTKFCPLFCPPQ
jgi:hypothetical protein